MSDGDFDPQAFHAFEQAGWERAAGHYPGTFGALTALAAVALLDAVDLRSGGRVLDVATGPGYVAAEAAARGAVVVGVDFSPSMIALARRRVAGVRFVEGDAEALAFGSGTFDAVVMNFGLLHLARPEAALAEAHRVLRPGGRYAYTVWAPPDQAVGFGIVLRAMEVHGTTDLPLPPGPPFFRFSAREASQAALERAGFRRVAVRQVPLVWRLRSAGDLFRAALHGGVRTSAALQAQTPRALDRIRAAVAEALAPYRDEEGFAVPMPIVLASGIR